MQTQSLTEKFGLPKRLKLIQIDAKTIGIIKKRKSRIIIKDGLQILDIAKQIRKLDKSLSIYLIIEGPICSKTISLLAKNKIEIVSES